MGPGYCSRPARVAAQYTKFLTERMNVGLYPEGIATDPLRVTYAPHPSNLIWRPLVPIGLYQRVGAHPLADYLHHPDAAFPRAYRRISEIIHHPSPELMAAGKRGTSVSMDEAEHKGFRGDREAFVDVALCRAWHLSNGSLRSSRLGETLIRCANVTGDNQVAALLLECALALHDFDDQDADRSSWMRRQLNKGAWIRKQVSMSINRMLLRRSGVEQVDYEGFVRDTLVGSYGYVLMNKPDVLSFAMAQFQLLSLVLKDPGIRQMAVGFMGELPQDRGDVAARARRDVEENLRMAWALVTHEPGVREHWLSAAKWLMTAASNAWVDPDMLEQGLPQEIDAFHELIHDVAVRGDGLVRAAASPRRGIAIMMSKME